MSQISEQQGILLYTLQQLPNWKVHYAANNLFYSSEEGDERSLPFRLRTLHVLERLGYLVAEQTNNPCDVFYVLSEQGKQWKPRQARLQRLKEQVEITHE